jgi:hypothetical protein
VPAPREADDFRSRHRLTHLYDDALRRFDAPLDEFLRRQYAGPGVENLYCIGDCLQLPDEIGRRRIDQHID